MTDRWTDDERMEDGAQTITMLSHNITIRGSDVASLV